MADLMQSIAWLAPLAAVIGLFMAYYIRNNAVREWVEYDPATDPNSPESREKAKKEKEASKKK